MRSSRSTTPSRPSYVKQDHGLASLTNMAACHGANNFVSRSMTIGYAFTAPPPSQTHLRTPFMMPHAAPLYPQKQHHFTTKITPLYLQKQHHFTPKNSTILLLKPHHFTSKTTPKNNTILPQKQHPKNSTILPPKLHQHCTKNNIILPLKQHHLPQKQHPKNSTILPSKLHDFTS